MPDDLRRKALSLYPDFARAQSLRCSAHEYRTLAQGGAHFCLSGMLTPWDHAAGVLLCQMAGGHAAMLDGSDYNAAMTEGYLLTASDKETWLRLKEQFAFLLNQEENN
jgi:fructose-1,6-bisphosphatase/inositol monophosphatase family enzyme